MKAYTNFYSQSGKPYRTREEAEKRLNTIVAQHKQIEQERIYDGKGPFLTKFEYTIVGNSSEGYRVREVITDPRP